MLKHWSEFKANLQCNGSSFSPGSLCSAGWGSRAAAEQLLRSISGAALLLPRAKPSLPRPPSGKAFLALGMGLNSTKDLLNQGHAGLLGYLQHWLSPAVAKRWKGKRLNEVLDRLFIFPVRGAKWLPGSLAKKGQNPPQQDVFQISHIAQQINSNTQDYSPQHHK